MVAVIDGILARLDSLFDRVGVSRAQDAPLACFLLAPALLVLGTFGVAPLVYAVYMSLFDFSGGGGSFIGLGNFAAAFESRTFWRSAWITIYYILLTIPIAMSLSFFVALGLFRITRLRALLRTMYFLPYITSSVAAAMIWRVMLQPEFGPANQLLIWAGLEPQRWLLEPRGALHVLSNGWIPASAGPSLALCCVIAFDIWHSMGFMVVVFLAGLTAIPSELEEAARMDGANVGRVVRHVTLPLLSPTVFFLVIISVIKSFQAFSSFYALTGNGRGPLDSTQNLTVYVYTNFYEYGRWGYGAAVATLLCVVIIVLTLVQWRWLGAKVYYE